jgi:two-component system, NtrC family, response regulator AtoC
MGSNSHEMMTEGSLGVRLTGTSREFIGGLCPALMTLESVIQEIAPTMIPVLLVGESGTGKEVFAHRIHELSGRAPEPVVKIACASVNAETLASETGLRGSGYQSAPGAPGTVIFDEISELDAVCQKILLYALPDGDFRPRPGVLASRVVSITSRKLDEEMRAGRFRSELYYRINGVCLRLPPLRERKEDIPVLSEFFLTKHAVQLGRPQFSLSQRTLRIFMDYNWPGNIRELENAVKNIVALGDEQLALSGLISTPISAPPPVAPEICIGPLKVAARAASREAEKELILKALEKTRWNRKRAAQELQISYKSLLYKLKQIGMPDSEVV